MRITVLGTGTVGRTLAAALAERGHDVTVGTRDVSTTMARSEPDAWGNPPFAAWSADHPDVAIAAFADAAADAELVVNATAGTSSLAALEAVGDGLAGAILVDVANALDFSGGAPALAVSDEGSLGQQIQARFPEARVVKTLNTMNASVMVDPAGVGGGDHTVFVSGDDPQAKEVVTELLATFGWTDILDLGGIGTAGAVERLLPLWIALLGTLGTPAIGFKVVR
jgi:predicted dinucleotide-binding enzyme